MTAVAETFNLDSLRSVIGQVSFITPGHFEDFQTNRADWLERANQVDNFIKAAASLESYGEPVPYQRRGQESSTSTLLHRTTDRYEGWASHNGVYRPDNTGLGVDVKLPYGQQLSHMFGFGIELVAVSTIEPAAVIAGTIYSQRTERERRFGTLISTGSPEQEAVIYYAGVKDFRLDEALVELLPQPDPNEKV